MRRINQLLYGIFIYDKDKYPDISIEELAELLGVTTGTIYKWIEETDRNISEKHISGIIKYLYKKKASWQKVCEHYLKGTPLAVVELPVSGDLGSVDKERKEALVEMANVMKTIFDGGSEEEQLERVNKLIKELVEFRDILKEGA